MHFPLLLFLIGSIGGATAIFATLIGRTRSDAKTVLAYATISQVGLIFIEISLGFTNFALFHMVTHASLRTYQFLRSSSLIQDFFENPTVEFNQEVKKHLLLEGFFSLEFRKKLYLHALHGFHLDFFTHQVMRGVLFPFEAFNRFETQWMEWNTQIMKKLLQFRKKQ